MPILLPIILAVAMNTPVQTEDFRTEAARLSSAIEQQFWIPDARHYTAYITDSGDKSPDPAFAWDMAVQLSGLAAAMRHDRAKYQPLFDRAERSLETYGSEYHEVFGYSVLPHQAKPDRFYDDDEWIALSQLDAYDATKDPRYLRLAERTFKFVMSGESNDLGGGLFWREQEKKSKNTCSNAPAVAVAARLFLATENHEYFDIAKQLHDWVERLKDPTDSLMFDNITLAGKIDKTKWTYNTALMIRGDLLLYKITKDRDYLEEAVAMGKSSIGHWIDPQTGAIHDESSFAHHLAEAFIDLAAVDQSQDWKGIAEKAIQYAYDNTSKDGLFTLRWDRFQDREHRVILLYQGSMARALWLAAQ